MTVKADVKEGILASDKVVELQNLLEVANIDSRIKIAFKGEDEEQRQG